jgi:hypothetical protein
MGVPSQAQVRRFADAWSTVADRGWAGRAAPVSFVRGTLVVAVTSAPLRERLAQFESERLLLALKERLPNDRVIAVRFVAAGEDL